MGAVEIFLTFLSPDLLRIYIDIAILILVILCFCSALYLVTEIRVPESTIEQCRKLNEIAHLEWIFNFALGVALILSRYFLCGFLAFPLGVYHFFKWTQRGNTIFQPIEIHRKASRDKHINFYSAKLIFYTILFLTVMIYVAFGVLDYALQFDWETILGTALFKGYRSDSDVTHYR